ncbi:MAG: YggS family pyridoxal phosphate-dependent enzyme [Rhodospirillales bacterium]
MSQPTAIEEALAMVREKVREAAVSAARSPDDVRLCAVSKTFDAETVSAALAAGHRLFGENRVQEAEGKWPGLRERYTDVELHLIGPLQSNKSAQALALFDVIQTIDRPKIARSLAAAEEKLGLKRRYYVQVNTGEEPQKAGALPAEADALVALCRDDLGLEIEGLMCIPPVDEEPALHFALLSKIAARNGLAGLSMGMSGDYETAIACGATLVRVGSAIFGTRPKPAA